MNKTNKMVQTLLTLHRKRYIIPMCSTLEIDIEGVLAGTSLDGNAGSSYDDDGNLEENDDDENRA
ncbi:hypothetical protein [Prevotella pallens]|uniref:hypothetical protein n=1 Tax=Prevotella pallens TaxID=60133 RepID=UPI0028D18EC9|nr:hypothetical protein [Prevotella pallens]